MTRVGPWLLERRLARGGMAAVWLGRHVELDAPVAVKVIASTPAPGSVADALSHEIRSVAALTHPGIVTVYDYGFVPPGTPGLSPGHAYLVMELATGGTLHDLNREDPIGSYRELREVLLALLDALAHAHARGVIHRDVKPANVLLTRGRDGDRTLKLTDFGIARILDERREERARPGTPHYMAPEQVTGDALALGPWTDLYAVGCLAYRLSAGRPPFAEAGESRAVMLAHVQRLPPALAPSFETPPGFDVWVSTLLAKRPAARYQRAADAAFALRALGEPEDGEGGEASRISRPSLPTLGDTPFSLADATRAESPRAAARPTTRSAAARFGAPRLHPAPRPPAAPIPPRWSTGRDDSVPLPMSGVGLGLFGLRAIPMIGRTAERDHLWERFREVAEASRCRLVVLRGPAGTGKSRLASWLARRAHEVGAATVLRATHGPAREPTDGVGPMLARAFGVDPSMDEDRLRLRVEATLEGLPSAGDPDRLESLLAFFRRPEGDRSIRDPAPVLYQTLLALTEERPVLVWLEDVHWGADTLELIEPLLSMPAPVLFVATARAGPPRSAGGDRDPVERSITSERGEAIDIGPLPAEAHATLVRWLLGLDRELIRQVARRTAGRPLFAVQLVGDWVQRGILEPGPDGFRLRPGVDVELPDDIHALWRQRVERLAAVHGAKVERCLEVAAALGGEVRVDEWGAACARLRTAPPPELLGTMLRQRLARETEPGGFTFAHGMLRESLERTSRAEGRWADAHRACAEAIEAAGPVDVERAEALARHWQAAGDEARALPHLDRAVHHLSELSRLATAEELWSQQAEIMDRLGIDEPDPRRLRHWLARAILLRQRGQVDAALEVVDRAAAIDPEHPEVLRRRMDLERLRGAAARDVLPLLERALASALSRGDLQAQCRVRSRLAGLLLSLGRFGDPVVRRHLDVALELSRTLGDDEARTQILVDRRLTSLAGGDIPTASREADEAIAVARRRGDLFNLGYAIWARGEVEVLSGDFEAARASFRRMKELWSVSGSGLTVVADQWLVFADVLEGRLDAAAAGLAEVAAHPFAESSRLTPDVAYARLACDAVSATPEIVGATIAAAEPFQPATGHAGLVYARCAAIAARLLEDRGERELARRARRLGRAHHDAFSGA